MSSIPANLSLLMVLRSSGSVLLNNLEMNLKTTLRDDCIGRIVGATLFRFVGMHGRGRELLLSGSPELTAMAVTHSINATEEQLT